MLIECYKKIIWWYGNHKTYLVWPHPVQKIKKNKIQKIKKNKIQKIKKNKIQKIKKNKKNKIQKIKKIKKIGSLTVHMAELKSTAQGWRIGIAIISQSHLSFIICILSRCSITRRLPLQKIDKWKFVWEWCF